MDTVRVAIIGTGGISHSHLKGYLSQGGRCKIVALCDIFPEKCSKLMEDLGVKMSQDITVTEDYKTLLNRDDIDLVSICLPPSLHCEVSCAFLLAGKNVLCEKPMASSLEEADKMIAAEKKSGKVLGIISQNRFYQDAWTVKKMLDSGVFGKVLLARANSMWYRGSNYYDLWWRGTWEKEGGGCVLNHAVHQIDMLSWFVGKLPDQVTAIFGNHAHKNSEVEDVGMALLSYPGAFAEINVSLNDMDERQYLQFQCEKASVAVPWSVKCMKQMPNGFPEADPESEKKFNDLFKTYEKLSFTGHDGEIANVLDCLQGKSALEVTSRHGRNALELIYSIYKSATTGKTVHLPIKQNDPFYTKEGTLSSVPRFYKKLKSIDNAEGEITLGSASKS
ncbi:Gfo/Idh/MocA family protein [Treponema parvum]|uniref:Gfo/Idh/MocA family protein n=1 Tax=Treponema parvum TaxID=138851 RepID=UPI001AEC0C17|nr:Gfo/Idh/MocA family oxidoreductase [Treponema parvum]QTQ17113.1 Gfo/Idh/MocA family oxidoreductase [Treponema parvum]